jgi:predicted homoserine dehydrogenase-like protein
VNLQRTLYRRLNSLEKNIRLGIVGIGSIGQGLAVQAEITPGITCVALADIRIERAIQCAQSFGRAYRVVASVDAMHETIERGDLAVCADANLIAQCGRVDVFLDASNAIEAAADFCATALKHRKHLIMMNSEADLLFGPYLFWLARQNGTIYSSCDGDQQVTLGHLVDEITFWGFDLVMAGNIKGFLDRYSDPTKIIPEADKRGLDYKMAASYTDGTKLNIEMALTANALGLRAPIPGMHGPRAAHVREALTLYDLPALWQRKQGVVDYVLGAEPKGGVFVVGYTENKSQRNTLSWYPSQMGGGPFYVFYRPYHLGPIEGMSTVAEAILEGNAHLQPSAGFRTNVYTYAKRNLRAGESLDGIGGYACYGMIENCAEAGNGLPIALADAMKIRRDIAKDERIAWADVEYGAGRSDITLYREAVRIAQA